jgi:hypothetical protein
VNNNELRRLSGKRQDGGYIEPSGHPAEKAMLRRRSKADEWAKTIVAFESPYRLKEMALPPAETPNTKELAVEQQQFKIRLAHDRHHLGAASLLIQKMYSWRGYEAGDMKHDPNRITLLAFDKEQIVGTITVGLDSRMGLTIDEMYKAEVDQLRAQGRRVAEVTKLAIDENIKSKRVLGSLFHIAVIYARNIHESTDFVIEVNPRHAPFYERMLGFKPLGPEKLCARVNAPAVLLVLDLDYLDKQVQRVGGTIPPPRGERSFYPFFFSKMDEIGITHRLAHGE